MCAVLRLTSIYYFICTDCISVCYPQINQVHWLIHIAIQLSLLSVSRALSSQMLFSICKHTFITIFVYKNTTILYSTIVRNEVYFLEVSLIIPITLVLWEKRGGGMSWGRFENGSISKNIT